MATTAEPAATRRTAGRNTNPFGGGIPLALAMIAMTGIGFYGTFFARLLETDFVHHLHGWAMTGWLFLVLAQATLIKTRKYRWHRILGWSSVAFFTVMMLSSWQIVALMLSGKTGTPFEFAKPFAWSDLVDFPLMFILYGGAIWLRKDRHLHSRLVSATMLAIVVPAVARVFNLIWTGPEGLFIAMHPTYLFILGVLAIAMWSDWKKGSLRWPFPFTFAWIAFAYASFFVVPQSQWFDGFARWMGSTI
jgi:hypothetical protein